MKIAAAILLFLVSSVGAGCGTPAEGPAPGAAAASGEGGSGAGSVGTSGQAGAAGQGGAGSASAGNGGGAGQAGYGASGGASGAAGHAGGSSGSASEYLEPVDLPACDTSNPEVQLIESNADWDTINSDSKRIFCVSPGDYTKLGNIVLTARGTAGKRRYILLNNGNDEHTGKLPKEALANFALTLDGASYWVIDRAASFDVGLTHSFVLGPDSTHNVFNRMFTQNIYHTMMVRSHADDNTIQNSRFDSITFKGIKADLATINVLELHDTTIEVKNLKILNNEFVNVKALRLARRPLGDPWDHTTPRQLGNFAGTIFDSNDVGFDSRLRTDCHGNLDPEGKCMRAEGGIGIKGGSDDPANPVIISNNHFWGHRRADADGLSGSGCAITAYMGAKNIKIRDNVVFDGTAGFVLADHYDAEYGTEDAEVSGNLLYDLGTIGGQDTSALMISQTVRATISHNVIVDARGNYAKIYYNYDSIFFGENVIINPEEDLLNTGNHAPVAGLDTNVVYDTATEAGYTEDYSFTTDNFTNEPRTIVLPHAKSAN